METVDLTRAEIIFPDGLRAREVITRSSAGHVVKFPGIRYCRMIYLNSVLERDWVCILDVNTSVIHYQEQPFKIRYFDELRNKVWTKYPDFLVFKDDGSIWVQEVKDNNKANESETKIIFELEELIVRHFGYEFEVITETEIKSGYKLENANELKKHRNVWVSEQIKRLVLEVFREKQKCTGSYLLQKIPYLTESQLLNLRARLFLSSDLDSPLSLETSYSLNKVRSIEAEQVYKALFRRAVI